jgi:superfamily II DNA or RNA helicase
LLKIIDKAKMTLEEYYSLYGARIKESSERLFIEDFLYPLLGSNIEFIIPQYQFIDRTGRSRRIDFVCRKGRYPIALEVNGETYHAEGIIPNETFDDNLFRQNEIIGLGYKLVRFSYSQLQSPSWRPIIKDALREEFMNSAPEMLGEYRLRPTPIQEEALQALDFHRSRGWKKSIVVLPTGTGKTILSALDAKRCGGRVLFLVHRLDILKQSVNAYKFAWGDLRIGYLTGDIRENELNCDVLFASKDTLRQPAEMARFKPNWFDYIVVDEIHHGQCPSYHDLLLCFEPKFMLGMTATPDRMDRKDIFELFDYNKAYEISLSEAIERGFLVPYTYYGLTDDIDYSRIRWQGNRYRVDDLERFLIIPKRNAAILKEYIEKGSGDKAIGFCVSIKHAERMAEYFKENGISATAIHSASAERDKLISDFRANKFQVAFTVDLFNEGVDFPNVRVLLFLRPTESKTVFIQQLGRGLRLCAGKDRVRVLDFIGNYKRANQLRKYLSKESHVTESIDETGRRRKKIEYTYSIGCEVKFSEQVEEIISRQDAEDLGIDKEDLKQAYFILAEKLSRKPSRTDLDENGEYKSGAYARLFGSWLKFLREVGEYTEASYHYPQGTHIGHILSILWFFGLTKRSGTHFDDRFIKMRGGLDEGRVGNYQRQVKYKLQAAMELGILEDDRSASTEEDFIPSLTLIGQELRRVLKSYLQSVDLRFPIEEDGVPSSQMTRSESEYNELLRRASKESKEAKRLLRKVFMGMPAVRQMMAYLYHVARSITIQKSDIYKEFFQAPFVQQYCDREGIEEATEEASKRRCPFLLNVLDALGVISIETSAVMIQKLLLIPDLVKPFEREEDSVASKRLRNVKNAWKDHADIITSEDLSIVRELFGSKFLTARYHLDELEIWGID